MKGGRESYLLLKVGESIRDEGHVFVVELDRRGDRHLLTPYHFSLSSQNKLSQNQHATSHMNLRAQPQPHIRAANILHTYVRRACKY